MAQKLYVYKEVGEGCNKRDAGRGQMDYEPRNTINLEKTKWADASNLKIWPAHLMLLKDSVCHIRALHEEQRHHELYSRGFQPRLNYEWRNLVSFRKTPEKKK